jgi:mono/diheme cytochrome c family protein
MPRKAHGLRNVGGFAVSAALLVVAAGCSVKAAPNANLITGKRLFVKNCASCHTLARADATGVIGPSLDNAFRESISEGFGRGIIRGIVEQQVQYPRTGGVMPKLPLSHQAVVDIAAYVSYAAAKPGQDPGLLATAVPGAGTGPPAVEKAGKLQINANPNGLLAYTAKTATATAGNVTITMGNMSGTMHDLAVQSGSNGPVLGHTSYITSGSSSVTLNLKAGTYTFFCQVPGHRAAGMSGTLTVK